MSETYKVRDVIDNDEVGYTQAIQTNMNTAIRKRRMRDGKLSVDALKGIVSEAQFWVLSYCKRTGTPPSKLDAVVEEVYNKHIKTAVMITDYKKCLM